MALAEKLTNWFTGGGNSFRAPEKVDRGRTMAAKDPYQDGPARPMTGLLGVMTPEQQAQFVLPHDGPEVSGRQDLPKIKRL